MRKAADFFLSARSCCLNVSSVVFMAASRIRLASLLVRVVKGNQHDLGMNMTRTMLIIGNIDRLHVRKPRQVLHRFEKLEHLAEIAVKRNLHRQQPRRPGQLEISRQQRRLQVLFSLRLHRVLLNAQPPKLIRQRPQKLPELPISRKLRAIIARSLVERSNLRVNIADAPDLSLRVLHFLDLLVNFSAAALKLLEAWNQKHPGNKAADRKNADGYDRIELANGHLTAPRWSMSSQAISNFSPVRPAH